MNLILLIFKMNCYNNYYFFCYNNYLNSFKRITNKNIISVKSKYVNLNNIENPISPYTEEITSYPLHYQSLTKALLTIEPHEISLDDNFYFSFLSPQTLKFNKIWDRERAFKSEDNYFGFDIITFVPFTLDIDLNSNTFQYKRKVLNFLEVTGIIGGLFELFEVVIGVFIGMVSSYSLRGQLLEEIKVNRKRNRELERDLYLVKSERKDMEKRDLDGNRGEDGERFEIFIWLFICCL